MRRAAPLVAALACAPEPPCGRVGEPTGAGSRGNVLLVVLDDVGIEQLGAWGVGTYPAHTPTIDCLCEVGVRFSQAWGASVCSPGRAEILTGRYARRYGIGDILADGGAPYALPDEEETLGELLGGAGYETAYAGKWHLASHGLHDAPSHPNRSGFDRFAGSLGNLANASAEPADEALGYYRYERVLDGRPEVVEAYATTQTADDAIAFLDDARSPWLVVLALNAPHAPLHAPPPHLLGWRPSPRSDVERYRAMLEVADRGIGRVLRSLDPDVLADTTVVLVGDNGTPAHALGPPFLRAHGKHTLFDGGIRVPLVVSGPVVRRPGVADAVVHVVDVLPTLAEIAGAVPSRPLDGESLLPLLDDHGLPGHDTVATFLSWPNGALQPAREAHAIRDQAYKLQTGSDGSVALFEVGPGAPVEGEDLLASGPEPEHLAAMRDLEAALAALEDRFEEDR